jgi:hypothetical protein
MLKKLKMEDFKPFNTPMITSYKLIKDDESLETMYRSMIGSILYVIGSRLDVMKVVVLVARFQYEPKESYVMAVI